MTQAGTIVGNLASAIGFSTEEATLIADLKAGSEDAFSILIAQYHQPLFSLIARSLDDPADASDITQEVFIKVFGRSAPSTVTPACAPGSYRIALHEASNQRRWWSRHKRREVTLDTPPSEVEEDAPTLAMILADSHGTPLDHAEQSELRASVESALRELPEAFRTVVVLREIEGFAYEEIAEVLSINLGTVKSRLTRGRHLLRDLLRPCLRPVRCEPAIASRRSA